MASETTVMILKDQTVPIAKGLICPTREVELTVRLLWDTQSQLHLHIDSVIYLLVQEPSNELKLQRVLQNPVQRPLT